MSVPWLQLGAATRSSTNVLASNNDDHSKNHAFLMDQEGTWSRSPAYDITFAYNPRSSWTAKHLMSVNGKFDAITRDDLHTVGETFGIRGYRRIIREVEAAVANWREFATAARLPEDRILEVGKRLEAVAL